MNDPSLENLPSFTADGPSFIPAAAKPVAEEEAKPADQTKTGGDDNATLIAAGEKVFKKCKACHKVGDGAKNGAGPMLNGIVGAPAGQVDGFGYSSALEAAAADGLVWDEEALHAFLTKPKDFIKKTKMAFGGLKKEEDRAAIIEYLKANGG